MPAETQGKNMKNTRQNLILQLIEEHEVDTQEELARLLKKAGFSVTQATISRDIRELNLKKVAGVTKSRYVHQKTGEVEKSRYLGVLKESFQGVEQAASLVVIKTVSGMAMAAAAALDHFALPEIVGTIAGDDTIMCATRSEQEAEHLVKAIQKLL